jgi:hypothetical protein
MKLIQSKSSKTGVIVLLLIGTTFGLLINSASAQQTSGSTPTPTGNSTTAFITVTYIEPINVREGPGSFDYSIIGSLQPGDTAPAIGRSPAGEWIQIVYQGGPLGKGWVYAPNVTLSPGALLPVVEPPPTKMPDVMLTPNATFAAELKTGMPSTRMPTFTAPLPLTIPTYQNPVGNINSRGFSGWAIFILGLAGTAIFMISKIGRK